VSNGAAGCGLFAPRSSRRERRPRSSSRPLHYTTLFCVNENQPLEAEQATGQDPADKLPAGRRAVQTWAYMPHGLDNVPAVRRSMVHVVGRLRRWVLGEGRGGSAVRCAHYCSGLACVSLPSTPSNLPLDRHRKSGRDSGSVGAFDDAVGRQDGEARCPAPPAATEVSSTSDDDGGGGGAERKKQKKKMNADHEDDDDDDDVCADLCCVLASKRRRNDGPCATSGPVARPANNQIAGVMVNCVRLRWRRGGRP
jgi:hypothetical protein